MGDVALAPFPCESRGSRGSKENKRDPAVTLPPQRQEAEAQLRDVQEQFKRFLVLLEQNNQVLKIIGDMEEKSQGEYLFDLNYIRSSLEDIRAAVGQIIEQLVVLSGGRCLPLRQRFEQIDGQIARMFPD